MRLTDMNTRTRKIVAVALLPFTLAACTQRHYDVTPVVGKDDPRKTSTPQMHETDKRAKQDCFMVSLHAQGITSDKEDEGIACMVPTTTTTQEVTK